MHLMNHIQTSLQILLLCLCFFAHNFYLEWLLSLSTRVQVLPQLFVPNLDKLGANHHNHEIQHFGISGPFVAADWESWWTYEGISGKLVC